MGPLCNRGGGGGLYQVGLGEVEKFKKIQHRWVVYTGLCGLGDSRKAYQHQAGTFKKPLI